MKITLLLIPLLFFMTSCTIDWNREKDKKIAELEKQIQNDTFKKNQECLGFLEKTTKEESYDNKEYFKEDEIFYSEKLQTCIYTLINFRGHEENNNDNSIIKNRFLIKDILRNEYLYDQSIFNNQKNGTEANSSYRNEFNKIKNSLKPIKL